MNLFNTFGVHCMFVIMTSISIDIELGVLIEFDKLCVFAVYSENMFLSKFKFCVNSIDTYQVTFIKIRIRFMCQQRYIFEFKLFSHTTQNKLFDKISALSPSTDFKFKIFRRMPLLISKYLGSTVHTFKTAYLFTFSF